MTYLIGQSMHVYDDFLWTPPAELEELALRDIPWAYYLGTEVHIEATDRSGTVRPAESGSENLPPLGPVHVITAVQPGPAQNDQNNARMDVLDRELRSAGVEAIRAVGSSFDGSHREESRAVFGLDDVQARRLGRRFGQVAVFAWSGPRWSLLACVGDRKTHRAWIWVQDER